MGHCTVRTMAEVLGNHVIIETDRSADEQTLASFLHLNGVAVAVVVRREDLRLVLAV